LEGLVMGTRCGDIDPAVVLHLQRLGHSIDEVDRMLNKEGGMLGMAGIGSNDMRDILKAVEGGNRNAKLAMEVFTHRLIKYVGSYAAVLNGFDALVFTAGIGENDPDLRSDVCRKLSFLGLEVDETRNRSREVVISKEGSKPTVLSVPTDEELMIARETSRVLRDTADHS
jgi:acetate kinase